MTRTKPYGHRSLHSRGCGRAVSLTPDRSGATRTVRHSAGEEMDLSTLAFLTRSVLKTREEEEEGKKVQAMLEEVLLAPSHASFGLDASSLCREEEEEEKEEEEASSLWPHSSSTSAVACSPCWFCWFLCTS